MRTHMKPRVRDALTAALTSGNYQPGRGLLHTTNGNHCPLGVLCELAVKAGAIDAPTTTSYGAFKYDGFISFLPPTVQRWSGMDRDTAARIAHMNDEGATFGEVAEYVATL